MNELIAKSSTEAQEILRPSKLQQYAACPGSYQMQFGMPDEPSLEAEEGTILHACVAKNTVEGLDAEQEEMVLSCRAFLEARIAASCLGTATFEQPIEVRNAAGNLLTKGTCDVLLTGKGDHCEVIDWKFGRVPVPDAARNLQLAAYAIGAMQLVKASSCTVHIYQPRIKHHAEYTFTQPEAILSNIQTVIARATKKVLILNAGEEQCRYCKAKAVCPAFRKTCDSLAVARDNADALATPETLADYYSRAQIAKKFVATIEDAMKAYLDEHGECCGYHYKEVAGKRECTDIAGLHCAVDGVISPSEFLECCTVSISSLEAAFIEKLCATAAVSGGKITKKDAKAKFAEMTERFVGRGKSTRRIERKED